MTNLEKASMQEKFAISKELMDKIVEILHSMVYGDMTLIAQNFRLVQIERNEKIRPSDMEEYGNIIKESCKNDYTTLCRKIQQQFHGLEYGQVVVVVKDGKIVQVERTEKYRFQNFTGLDGEGI